MRKKDTTAEESRDPYHFTMRHARASSWWIIIGLLFWGVVLFFLFFIIEPDWTMVPFGALVLLAMFFGVLHGIYWKFWNVRIEGTQIHYTSPLRRRTFSLHEIRSVRGRYSNRSGVRRLAGFTVHSDTKKLFFVGVDYTGYKLFVWRLKRQNIAVPGCPFAPIVDLEDDALDLDETEEKTVSVGAALKLGFHTVWGKGAILWWFQMVLWAVAAVGLVVILFYSDRWFLSGANTVPEILQGYLIWYWVSLVSLAGATALIVSGNVVILIVLKRKKHLGKKHVIMAIIGILTILPLAIGITVYENIPGLIRDVQSDIVAIEQGDLPETNYSLHLHWTSFYRTASPRDMGDYRPLYVVRAGDLGRLYFPRNLSPATLQERAADDMYQIPGQAASLRVFAVRYTPNFQVVVEAVPLRGT